MNTRIDYELQPPLPPIALRAAQWTLDEKCNFASQLYNSIYYSVTMTLVRELGYDRTYAIHADLLRHHQQHFFIDGLKKLGLDKETSDAVRCAKYHCMSNAIGGVRTGFAVENDKKAWMFYFPHTPDNAWPGQASVAHSRGNMLSDYRGWHSNNGKMLGNSGLRYVATHFVCEGDPFDGGYFEDTGRELGPEELLIQRLGEEPPAHVAIQKTQLAASEWPADRKAKALRNYAVTWVADRVKSVLDACGERGDDHVQRAFQAILFAWMPRFLAAVGDGSDHARDLASYIELFHAVTGVATTRKTGDVHEVVLGSGLQSFVGGEQTEAEQARFAAMLGRAWNNVGARMGCAVTVDATGTRWTVRSGA